MGILDDRIAVITGAGNGLGREHARLFAREGAKVVVNDLGSNPDGTGADASPAQQVVDEIVAAGGEAVANYGAAKAGIAAMTLVAAAELGRIGVRVNAVAPVARTRLTQDVPMIGEMMRKPEDPDAFDAFAPEHVSPLVAYLASERCEATGRLFNVGGGSISEIHGWTTGEAWSTDGPWTVEGVAALFNPVAAA